MAKNTDIFLGIDFGTGGCKITAIAQDGRPVGEDSLEYQTFFEHQGWAEQEPASWYETMRRVLRNLQAKGVDLQAVKAVSFDGSTHNAVLLDSDYRPLRRTIMWTDQRSVEECAELRRTCADRLFQVAYQMPAPTWTLPQLMWLKKHEPQVLDKTRHVLFVKDYVRYQMTGVAVTDYIEAQGTLFYDMRAQAWSTEFAALAGLSADALPRLVKPTDIVGEVTAQAAADTGLPAGIPVICGTSDSAVEDYGAGAIRPGDCILKLATAGNVNVMTAEAHPHPATLTYSHVIPGMWYTVTATNAAALCQRWFRDLCCDKEKAEALERGVSPFQIMGEEAEKSPIGANGVFFHPYLQGERSPYWDANLRASFTGLSIGSGKGDMLRALLEGVAFSLRDCYRTIEEMKLPVNRLFLIGGGARGELWSQIVCDVFNLPASVPAPGDASFGTALLAATGCGRFASAAEAVEHCLTFRRELRPVKDSADKYAELFPRYRAIHDALANIYNGKF